MNDFILATHDGVTIISGNEIGLQALRQRPWSMEFSGGRGGESVSQSPLKDKVFSTFLDQNPPFELRKRILHPTKSCQRPACNTTAPDGRDPRSAYRDDDLADGVPFLDRASASAAERNGNDF
jgi:hypothetical protein